MREVTTTQYIADDGRVFDDKDECHKHEFVMYRIQTWESMENEIARTAKEFVDTFEKAGDMTRKHMIQGIMAWEKHLALNCKDVKTVRLDNIPSFSPGGVRADETMDQESEHYEQEQA